MSADHNNIPPSFGEKKSNPKLFHGQQIWRKIPFEDFDRFRFQFPLLWISPWQWNLRPDVDSVQIIHSCFRIVCARITHMCIYTYMLCGDAMQCLFSLSITTITASARARELWSMTLLLKDKTLNASNLHANNQVNTSNYTMEQVLPPKFYLKHIWFLWNENFLACLASFVIISFKVTSCVLTKCLLASRVVLSANLN